MARRASRTLILLAMALVAVLTCPAPAGAQDVTTADAAGPARFRFPAASLDAPRPAVTPAAFKGDPVWEGVLIGGVVGAVSGLIVAPYAMCGSNDSECSVIVRVAVGLPILAGGMVVGGLVDRFHVRGPIVWRDGSGRNIARVGTFPTGGAGIQLSMGFK
jgi:hypothetical protein